MAMGSILFNYWLLSLLLGETVLNGPCYAKSQLVNPSNHADNARDYEKENPCTKKTCQCNDSKVIECTRLQNETIESFLRVIPPSLERLKITDSEFTSKEHVTIPEDDKGRSEKLVTPATKPIPQLLYVEIIGTDLSTMSNLKFGNILNLQQLKLNDNNLTHINSFHLKNLDKLEVLNMSHNNINSISLDALTSLQQLNTLDLSYNSLNSLSNTTVFQSLKSLIKLDLSHNELHYIHPRIFYNLQNLETIHLEFNLLVALQKETFFNMTNNLKLYLGHNPWNCDCGINWIVDELQHGQINTYLDLDSVLCGSPEHLRSNRVINLNTSNLECEEPDLSSNNSIVPYNTSINFLHSAFLHCVATGFPRPSIYWVGPRGVLVHPSHHQWLPHDIHEFSDYQEWAGGPTFFNATVTALDNGSLAFRNFRYNFDGLYTCVAVNPVGAVSVTVDVNITTQMIHHLIWSVLFGGFCSLLMLLVGITIGSIQWIAERTCCKKDLEKSAIEHYYSEDIPEDSESYWEDYFRYLPYEYPDPTSRQSPMKCVTPAEPIEAEASRLAIEEDIWQTLVDVRSSLRNTIERQMEWVRTHTNTMRDSSRIFKSNVGKKVERVRFKAQRIQQSSHHYVQSIRDSSSTRIQSIRESSSTKLKTIRNSSSQYALRMKSGVADKVESVRGQVKSLKEFCGTGEIGQTMSVISVSTNVDSQEQSIEQKSHTIV